MAEWGRVVGVHLQLPLLQLQSIINVYRPICLMDGVTLLHGRRCDVLVQITSEHLFLKKKQTLKLWNSGVTSWLPLCSHIPLQVSKWPHQESRLHLHQWASFDCQNKTQTQRFMKLIFINGTLLCFRVSEMPSPCSKDFPTAAKTLESVK